MTTATATAAHPLLPTWGTRNFMHDTLDSAVAVWGARGIAAAPAWDGRPVARGGRHRERPASLPRVTLDLLHDRQDCRAVEGFDRSRLRMPLDKCLSTVRGLLATHGVPYYPDDHAPVTVVNVAGIDATMYAYLSDGYAYITCVFTLTAAK